VIQGFELRGVAAAALVLTTLACGSEAVEERDARVLALPRNAAGRVEPSFGLLEWVAGPAELEVVFRGGGRGMLACELEGGVRVPLLELGGESQGGTNALVTRTVPLHGSSRRPARAEVRGVRLVFAAGDGLEWVSARLLGPEPPRARRPHDLAGTLEGRNVVLFLTDALHARHMSCYGNERPTTPALDRLAREGLRFATAYAQTSWTLPSVASLFTGLEQERHGVTYLTARLGDEPQTLAEQFASAGYRTVALVQNGVIWPQTGLDRGFERYELFEWTQASFQELMRAVEELFAQRHRRPLFLYVHAIPPHGPFTTPEDLRRGFDPGYQGTIDGSVASAVAISQAGLPADHPDVVQFAALYDEYLAYVDHEIGRLVERLRTSGRDGEFALVHLSDHGEAFMQHGVLGHALHVYEEQVRIPLILWAPDSDLPAGAVVQAPASLLDVLPTLIELCGLPDLAAPLGGRSLVPAIAGVPQAARPLFLSSRYRGDAGLSRQIGLVIGGHKLVAWRETSLPADWRLELYDLARDPGETRDLAQERPLLAGALERELRRFVAEAAAARSDATENEELDPAVLEQLQGLGYVR
jgi:arylsulfatase